MDALHFRARGRYAKDDPAVNSAELSLRRIQQARFILKYAEDFGRQFLDISLPVQVTPRACPRNSALPPQRRPFPAATNGLERVLPAPKGQDSDSPPKTRFTAS